MVSAADPAVDWRSADIRCPSAGHLDEEDEEVDAAKSASEKLIICASVPRAKDACRVGGANDG